MAAAKTCVKQEPLGHTLAGAQVLGAQAPMSLAMPFIDNDLLWCPDNDGKMVDLSSCLQVIIDLTS